VNITVTLFVQMAVFIALIIFTMKVVWPMILGPMQAREQKIAADLAAAEKGRQDFNQAEKRAEDLVREARERANQIIDQAQHRANEIVDQARTTAVAEGARLAAAAQQQIALEQNRARDQLRREVGQLAISTASKLLKREIDPRKHAELLDELATEL
jgi:F-type H+-transporting ATPase subunit b